MNFYFYQSFIDLLINKPKLIPELKDKDFRNFILEKKGKNLETLKLFQNNLIYILQKPQRLLYTDINYYIAIDLYTNTYYICYRNLMMLDIDFHKNNLDLNQSLQIIENFCKKHQNYKFRIYLSKNGIHAFIIHKSKNYQKDKNLQIMLDLQSDFFYTLFSSLRGWCVRLNKKKEEDNDVDIYTYLKDVGYGKEDYYLCKLVKLHINMMYIFQNEKRNLMY